MRFIVRRLVLLVPVLFGVSLLSFGVIRLIPGDPARVLAGEEATQAQVEQIRQQYGLDQPIVVQYGLYLGRLVVGDLGTSYRNRQPVAGLIWERFRFTLQLAALSMGVSMTIGIVLGTIAGTHRGSAIDRVSMMTSLVGISVPTFWLGIILILIFSVWLHLLPTGGQGTPAHFVLPALTLGAAAAAAVARLTRSVMVEVLEQEYIVTARAKGLREQTVVVQHALRNAFFPVITVIGLQFGQMISGAVFTETVFALPGLGRLVVESIFARDYPVVQGSVLLAAAGFVLVNLVIDVLYGVLDPRTRRA
jgi:peptide/nickel transport system permease protein